MILNPRLEEANKIVNNYSKWSAVAGVIPVPVLDVAAISGTQLKMIHALSETYNVEFKSEMVRSIVGALIGGVGARTLAFGSIGGFIKGIPGVGTLIGMVAMPLASGATAYAIGKVFIKHFEMGGTLLDFNVGSSREYFQKELENGKKVVEEPKKTTK